MMLSNTIGKPSAPISSGAPELLVMRKRKASSPASFTQRRSTLNGASAPMLAVMSAAAITLPPFASSRIGLRACAEAKSRHSPPGARTRRFRSPIWL